MRLRALFLLTLASAAVLDGCARFTAPTEASTDTPERAFERVNRALQSRDWGALYDAAASPSTRAKFGAEFEKTREALARNGGDAMFAKSVLGVSTDEYRRMSARDFFVKTSAAAGRPANLLIMLPSPERMRDARVVDTKVEGDAATVTLDVGDKRRKMPMIRENGRWYLRVVGDD